MGWGRGRIKRRWKERGVGAGWVGGRIRIEGERQVEGERKIRGRKGSEGACAKQQTYSTIRYSLATVRTTTLNIHYGIIIMIIQ